ncbi:MAG: acyl carrier protein [Oscillospiraceae bacterium]|nr:acyl carrier protein [Oscillospiraceae bacterium]MCR5167220.1 acyl carrier protein [Oscillospiraceae bacterium]
MLEKFKEIICNYVEVAPEDITEDSRFIEDLGFNSYDIMCMLGDAESEFDIEIDQEKIADMKTVGEVLEYFGGLVNE